MVWEKIPRERLSPMMQHYVEIKEAHPDCLILYRLGDFYEMFFEDAKEGARILELTLTSRDCGLDERCPMAGVPHHVIESYAAKLVQAGHKVCLVDQMEDPKKAVGLVKRAVTRILTPGTLTDSETLEASSNNFLLVIYPYRGTIGLCYADISTGQMEATEFSSRKTSCKELDDWVEMLHPAEIVLVDDTENQSENDAISLHYQQQNIFLSRAARGDVSATILRSRLNAHLGERGWLEFRHHLIAQVAICVLLEKVYAFREEPLAHLNQVRWIHPKKYLRMNAATRENLEIARNLENGGRKDTLLSVIDRTMTAMGSRKLAYWLDFPLIDEEAIQHRLDLVELFRSHLRERLYMQELLASIYDLERLLSKLSFGRGNARDLYSFGQSLSQIPDLIAIVKSLPSTATATLLAGIDPLADLKEAITEAIVDEPPIAVNEGGMIRSGYSEALDLLKAGSDNAREALVAYEQEQREKTGIHNLRVVYRKNLGYFIEVTNSNLSRVPEEYQRRQTLKNAERFTTPYLQQQADRISGNSVQVEEMEYAIFSEIRDRVSQQAVRVQQTADTLAELDALLSLAKVAEENGYVRPQFHEVHEAESGTEEIEIRDGRHPVVERQSGMDFIANDLLIGSSRNRIQLITGPNMAGKSTYMRQNALILILAQMGSFVPAASCKLAICDQIFTRIGARDHLAKGESTFMVEMKEMADIIEKATPHSFLVLDEVGRGTSTNDGLSIAYAILEYLSDHLPAITLFATHYHELTELAERKENIVNRTVAIEEQNGSLVFLRKVVEGYADRSYGVEVARLSGLPKAILDRAEDLLIQFDAISPRDSEIVSSKEAKSQTESTVTSGSDEFSIRTLLLEMRDTDINQLTPLESMQILSQWVEKAKEVKL